MKYSRKFFHAIFVSVNLKLLLFYMHCDGFVYKIWSITTLEVLIFPPPFWLMFYSEVNITATYKSVKKLFIETTLIILTVCICLTSNFEHTTLYGD